MNSCINYQIIKRAKQKFLSIAGLEKKAGLSKGVIRGIITKDSPNPTISVLISIAKALECTVMELLENEPSFETSNGYKPFNEALYYSSVENVIGFCKQKGLSFSSYDMCMIIKSVYLYSLSSAQNVADASFSEWIIGDYLKKSGGYLVSTGEGSTTSLKEKTPTA